VGYAKLPNKIWYKNILKTECACHELLASVPRCKVLERSVIRS
jgi:hypothetical protein